jgi:hypothetical protein
MVKPFKFLNQNEDEEYESYDGASWMFGRMEDLQRYEYETYIEYHNGIHSFLSNFPNQYIVTILSITGPNNIEQNADTENDGNGWGFDITSDRLRIEWVQIRYS